jgi:hypothetical protein
MKRGLREIGWRDGSLSNGDIDPALAGGGIRLDLQLVTAETDKQSPLGPGMLHRDSQEFLNQLGKNDLA